MSDGDTIIAQLCGPERELPLPERSVLGLPWGVHVAAAEGATNRFGLLVALPPGVEARVGSSRPSPYLVFVPPGEVFTLQRGGEALGPFRIERRSRVGPAERLGAAQCQRCRRFLKADAPALHCPRCGLLACVANCAPDGECPHCRVEHRVGGKPTNPGGVG